MRRFALALLLCLATIASAQAPETQLLVGPTTRVIDGDTLDILVRGETHRVRLAQIDAPESGQPYGREATAALEKLALHKHTRVTVVATDRYGRAVGEVQVGSLDVNQAMVRDGHAWAYTHYSHSLEIIDLENAARAAKKGLWALPLEDRDAPWEWRRKPHAKPELPVSKPGCTERRTCSQMATCEEARFHLTHCGLTRLDADGDGIPCEKLCRE
jgi:endonuclease YncB( thermonuclease family)